jgi:type I restriction enzyme, S subunit
MKQVLLSDVCEINPRIDSGISDDAECSFVPMEYVDEVSGAIANTSVRRVGDVKKGYTFFKNDDVIFAKITPCMENGKCAIGKNLKNGIAFGSTEYHVVRAKEEIIPEWIYHFLRQEKVRQQATGWFRGTAGQQRVPASFLEELKIPLPPLTEQKRIASLLARADRLRQLRRTAHDLGDGLLQSVFLEMFYNTESKWELSTVEDLAKKKNNAIRTGPFGSQLLHSEFTETGDVLVLGIDNAVQNEFSWGKPRYITTEKYQELKRYTVFPGDLIITIMATNGRVAVVPDNIPLAINTKHLCCITLDQKICLPKFLQACFLYHPTVLEQMGGSKRGAVMPGLNMEIIKNLVVPVPPLSKQEEFASEVARVENLRFQQAESERQVENLFQSLLAESFGGEA